MDSSITSFIKKQTCATIGYVDDKGLPNCFSCFFAFDEVNGLLYFKSSPGAKHCEQLLLSPNVSGTILPDKLKPLLVQGIQFTGEVLNELNPLAAGASGYYHKKNPLALAMSGKVWTVKIGFIKMTDSSKGFGKKIIWERKATLTTSL